MERITLDEKNFYVMRKLFTTKTLFRNTKVKMYKTLVKTVFVYEPEICTLTKKMEGELMVFENKVIRKVFGLPEEIGEFRRRKNSEIWELYKEAVVVGMVKSGRIEWT